MKNPSIRYLISSPYGDIPVDKRKWHLPLEVDALKTPYKKYFHTIRDFIIRDKLKPLLESASKKLRRELPIGEITEIIVRSEKHGFLYHPASIEVVLNEGKVKFGLNVAISDVGKNWLREEFFVLQRLHKKFNMLYLPRPYIFEESHSMSFLIEEWFEGYHEFHISKDEEGKQRLKLWNFGDSRSGYTYLSSEQNFEIYKQAAKILTFYYDLKDYSQILLWHHAAGDFVVKTEDKKIDVRLTTARRYEPLMVLKETDPVNPFLGLLCFLLSMTIRMRLDKLDGLGETVWMDDLCLEATVTGFLEALRLKKDEPYSGLEDEFVRLLKTFKEEELKIAFNPLLDLYNGEEDYLVVMANLENHTRKLYTILQNHPL